MYEVINFRSINHSFNLEVKVLFRKPALIRKNLHTFKIKRLISV